MTSPQQETQLIHWLEDGQPQQYPWHSESDAKAPKRVQIADDTLNADTAYRLACEGTALLWRGDFQNAKQLVQALARRIEKSEAEKAIKNQKKSKTPISQVDAFHLHRQAQSQRARVLAMVLITLDANYQIPLKRAPDVQQACLEAYGTSTTGFIVSLRELLGVVGAYEWRRKGVAIPALEASIHPHYGVFSPVRGEYLNLIAQAPLASKKLAFDIGTGSGVIAALLAKRGVQKIIATDNDQRALDCAHANLTQLGLLNQVELCKTDLFPEGRAALIVCNPPWLPVRPNSPIEHAVYDPESRMVKAFLSGVAQHVEANGEVWLIMSNLAELLGLRQEHELSTWIKEGGLKVKDKLDIRPQHPKSQDASDPLHAARSAEVTSLWQLVLA